MKDFVADDRRCLAFGRVSNSTHLDFTAADFRCEDYGKVQSSPNQAFAGRPQSVVPAARRFNILGRQAQNILSHEPYRIMELRLLRYFVAVAEELNVSRAAERLHTSQPSLSQQVKRLEQIVGTPLFRREKYHLQLTEAGRVFLEHAQSILREVEVAMLLARQAAQGEAGQIAIGLMPGAEGKVFSAVLAKLVRDYRDVHIALRTLSSPEQIKALQNHEINIGFLRGPINDEQIACEVFDRERILAILPAQHPLAGRERCRSLCLRRRR